MPAECSTAITSKQMLTSTQRRVQNPRLHLRLVFGELVDQPNVGWGGRIRIVARVLGRGCCSGVWRSLGSGANNPKLEAEQFANFDLNLDSASKR
jgi:hypothetical protein